MVRILEHEPDVTPDRRGALPRQIDPVDPDGPGEGEAEADEEFKQGRLARAVEPATCLRALSTLSSRAPPPKDSEIALGRHPSLRDFLGRQHMAAVQADGIAGSLFRPRDAKMLAAAIHRTLV